LALVQKNISQEIIISPHKVEAYYLGHKDEFKVEDEVKLRMIVLNQSSDPAAPSSEKLVEEITTKLKQGATFDEMEKIYSQETARNEGGRWNKKNKLPLALAELAFPLDPEKSRGVLSRPAGDNYGICKYENGRCVVARHYAADPDSKKESLVEEKKIGPS